MGSSEYILKFEKRTYRWALGSLIILSKEPIDGL